MSLAGAFLGFGQKGSSPVHLRDGLSNFPRSEEHISGQRPKRTESFTSFASFGARQTLICQGSLRDNGSGSFNLNDKSQADLLVATYPWYAPRNPSITSQAMDENRTRFEFVFALYKQMPGVFVPKSCHFACPALPSVPNDI